MANENISNDSGPIQPPEWNISELARQHGKHRKTIKRWIDSGWRPDQDNAEAEADEPEILRSEQTAHTDAHPAHQDVVRVEPQIILPRAPLAHLDAQVSAHPLRTPAHRRV